MPRRFKYRQPPIAALLPRRWSRVIAVLALLVAAAVGALTKEQNRPIDGPVIEGRASVIDGDTIEIHGQRIRFHGIDAPESSQQCTDVAGKAYRCGQKAAFFLDDMLKDKVVACIQSGTDRYKRAIASCTVNGKDIEAAMVDAGMAVAYRQYSRDYISNEERAKAARVGIWQGPFEIPSTYRRSP